MKLSKIYSAVFIALSPLALAETAQQAVQLDEVHVIAGRDPSQWAEYANPSESISKNALLARQPTSVADALKYLNNLDIQGGARPLAQKPTIRGIGGNRVVQVIDGVRQNFDLEHRGSYFLPLSLVQELEVIKGPASSLWGSGALGGVVAMRTPTALDLLKANQTVGANLRQGYQSANRLSETEGSVFMANDRFDALLAGFYHDADNLRLGKGEKQPNSAYRQTGGLAKLGWQIDDSNRLELSHRLSKANQVAPSNNELASEFTFEALTQIIRNCHTNPAASCDMTKIYGELGSISYLTRQQITDQSSVLNYYFNPKDNPYFNTQFTLYRNSTLEKEARLNSDIRDQTKLTTKGFNLRNTSDLNGAIFTYGVDYYQDHARTERGKNATDAYRADPYNVKSTVTDAYLLAHFPLFEQRLILSPSVRYDRYKTTNRQGEYANTQDDRWSPAVALTWKTTPWLDLSARYTEAFRAPSIQERYSSGAHFGTAMRNRSAINHFLENPNLQPETAKNKELNANLHFENVFREQDKLSLEATYFQNDVKNLINLEVYSSNPRSPFPNISQYQNVANVRLQGVELAANYATERVSLLAHYAQTHGKNRSNHEALANVPAAKFGVAVNYAVLTDKLDLGARITRYQAQKRVPSQYATHYRGYTLTDLQVGYTPMGKNGALRFDVAVENLFDKQYQPAFSLMEGTGRNIKASVNYSF
ncbi:TonB-dependent hemoglobin/transferrin/lactoferrin family receptor [Muribacter muris]|uniref:TonB-dependent hemoglobin/transferrin/lactoferrin family receptor n=1 Tax=Muribacter muris TaxID=67855 RepID=A0A4Y9K501_9PAST|nr:TonB-dependent hemoglobin/transferrin/lactoferrin family receptor [Muribacter muris]MBF0784068.1 TonB-dependent hemoglobin/transferrin/lactoferrin family receptor [Muribacter muris]MBF0827563.1 TonB-dependent hemoglobin/transferrin/lactoferrin family receptor [Muribacter muris]TFV13123.1 TonB-dependent hemoglobin/transferrin/lactoferrin family receptor [Muribacter muris]